MTGSSGVVGNDSYRCYADITTLVNTHRSGFYGCASIPCTTVPTATIEQGGGYIFAIVTSNPKYSATGISLNLSNDNFGQIGTNIPIITPTSGSVNGSLAVGVIEASATNGDGLKVQNVYPVSGTFRPPGNFFNALISDNSGTGAVYTNATFGTRNQNGVAFSNMVGGRQGLDLAIFPIPSGAIPANSTTYFMDGDSVGITPPGNDRTLYMLYGSAILPSAALPNITKSVDKGLAQGGDVLYYTLSVALGGTGTVNNLIIYDSLPNSVTMIPNSVAVNGVTVPGANLVTGLQLFPVVTLPMTSTVTFAVSINTPATVDSVPNTYTTTYRNPVSNGTIYTTTIVSNIALTTIVAAPSFELTKNVDKNYTVLGDTITYRITYNNKGTGASMHTTFIDTLPTTAILIPGSVVVNGVPSGSASNPLLIDLATVPPNTFGTITFSIVVNTVPTPLTIPNTSSLSYLYDSAGTTLANSKLSNLVTTTIISANLLSQKVVDKITASLGDTLTYTITFRNNGNTGINNLYFIDTIPQGTNYVPNTFTQDGSTIIGSPGTGLTLPNGVNPNSTTTIQFKVVIVSKPNPNPIPNSATGKGTFLIDPSTVPMLLGLATTTTTIVNTQVNYAALSIVKNVDKNYASCGDTLSYTISILNGGTTNATQVLFKDTLPQGTLLIPDSVRINGTIISGANLTVGVTLPDITADSSTTISFQVAVVC